MSNLQDQTNQLPTAGLGNSGPSTPLNAPTGPRSQSGGSRGRNHSNGRRGGASQPTSRPNSNGPPQSNNHRDRSSSRGGRGGGGRGGFSNFGNRSSSGGSPTRGGFGGQNGSRPSSTGTSPHPMGRSTSSNNGVSYNQPNAPTTSFNASSTGRSQSRGGGPQARTPSRSNTGAQNQAQPSTVNDIKQTGSSPTKEVQAMRNNINENVQNADESLVGNGRPKSQPGNSSQSPPAIPSTATPVLQAKPELPQLDTSEATTKKKRSRNSRRKKNESAHKASENTEDVNGEDADNEAASGSDDPVSASPLNLGFGADLVTATLNTDSTTITMIPVPGVPGGDPTAAIIEAMGEAEVEVQDGEGAKPDLKNFVLPVMDDFRRKNSRYKLLNTRRELTTAVEQMEVYTVVVHSRAANEVVNAIKSVTDSLKEGVPDCQHLRRLVRPENLPPSLTGLPDSLFVDYTTENTSPPFKVNPDGSVEKRSRGSSRAQRRRRNASYRKGEKPLYVLLCPVVTMTIRDLYKILSAHPLFAGVDLDCEIPFEAQDIPQIVKHVVPQWAPCNQKQSNYWTEKYWPTIYRRTNPYGPHHFLVNKWDDKLNLPYPKEEMDYIDYDGPELSVGEYYMRLARKVAEEGQKNGAGLRIGCVVVEMSDKDTPRHGRVIVAAHDARIQSGNPLAHSCYRVISLVGRKRVEATSRHKPKINIVSVNGPNSAMENDFYGRVPGDPDAYLMNDLAVFMTHEPCVMCSMAMVHSRIGCFVFGEKMATGGLHADLAPPDGHTLPVKGVTNEDVDNYRRKKGMTPADLRKRRTGDESLLGEGGAGGAGDEQVTQIEVQIKQHKSKTKTLQQKTRKRNKKAREEEGNEGQDGDEIVQEVPKVPIEIKPILPAKTKEELLQAAAAELKKEWSPIDPAIKGSEAIIEICRDKASLNMIKERDLPKFQAIGDALIAGRDTQTEEASLHARIAASQESQRKEHKFDDGSQSAKIFDPIKGGVDYLGAASKVNIGEPAVKEERSLERSPNRLTSDNLRVFEDGAKQNDTQNTSSTIEDSGVFAQTCSVFNADSTYAKSTTDHDITDVQMMPKIEEEARVIEGDSHLQQGARKEGSSGTKVDPPREESPGVFGELGDIDIDGVNENSTFMTTVEIPTGQTKTLDGFDQKPTDDSERGRSRDPAPFKPGTGEFVPVNISYGSPSGDSTEEFTTSGGEDTAGTGVEDSDPDNINVGSAFDLITMEVPDTADGENNATAEGEKRKKKRKSRKKRSRGKKKAEGGEEATDDKNLDIKAGSVGNTESFEIVDTKDAKEDASVQDANTASNTHGSSTTIITAPSTSSGDVNEDQASGNTNIATSRPPTPPDNENPDAIPNTEEAEAEAENEVVEDSEPDELVKPQRPFKILEDRMNAGFPQYDHGPGDGYGLFWREKLNWKFVCFQYKPKDDEEPWDYSIEWMGMGNDLLHA